MGGSLYLQNGQSPNRGNVCVSGYERGKENYALSNFENNDGNGYIFNDPDLGMVKFPTSEHYLHFQKLTPEAKSSHYNAWSNEPSPGEILRGIRSPGSQFYINKNDSKYHQNGSFNSQAWDQDKIAVQMQINVSKYQQSAKFRKAIDTSIELGNSFGDGEGPSVIIEDTSSASHKVESIWGTGPSGEGTNILGNSQTATARLIQQGYNYDTPPALDNFKTRAANQAYKHAKSQYENDFQPNLKQIRAASGYNANVTGQPDTSNLGPNLVQPVKVRNGVIMTDSIKKDYFYSKNENQRLVIQNNKVIGYEYRNNSFSKWQISGDPSRYSKLENAYYGQRNNSSQTFSQQTQDRTNQNKQSFNHFKNSVRVMKLEPISIPDFISTDYFGQEASYSIQGVSAAFIHHGINNDALKLMFNNDDHMETALETFQEVGLKVKMEQDVNGIRCISILGGLPALEAVENDIKRMDGLSLLSMR